MGYHSGDHGDIMIHGGCSKFLDPQTAILRNPTFIFRGEFMLKYVAKYFAPKKNFRELRKKIAGSHVGTLAALAIKKPYNSTWTFRTTPTY